METKRETKTEIFEDQDFLICPWCYAYCSDKELPAPCDNCRRIIREEDLRNDED